MLSRTLHAQHPVTTNLHVSPRFSPTIFSRDDANSVVLLAHLCTAVLIGSMRRTLCWKLFVRRAWRSIYTCTTEMFSRRTLFGRILCHNFPSLPGSRQRRLIPIQTQYFYENTFVQPVDSVPRKTCVRNCSRELEGLYNGNVLLASKSLYSSIDRLYAQNAVFKIVHDEREREGRSTYVQRECSAEPSMSRILCC